MYRNRQEINNKSDRKENTDASTENKVKNIMYVYLKKETCSELNQIR